MKRGPSRIQSSVITWSCFEAPSLAFSSQDPCLSLGVPTWTNNQIRFAFVGEFGVPYFVESSADFQDWVPVATNNDPAITRVITLDALAPAGFYRASRGPHPICVAGLAVNLSLNVKGNNIYTDGYDSADTIHFPNGLWNPTYAFAGGDVATGTGLLSVGNAYIHGRLLLGPSATFSLGTNGLVGDMPANWPAQNGVQSPAWVFNDYNKEFPDVIAPYNSGALPPYGSTTNTYYLASGSYYVSSDLTLNNNQVLYVAGVATLYVTGNFNAKNGSQITIGPGAVLKLYVGTPTGPAVSCVFNIVNNSPQNNAFNFQVFGLPSMSTFVMVGNDTYMGTIYAPEANLIINGGSSGGLDYQGAVAVDAVTINSNLNFHFDTNLKRVGPTR